MTTHGDDLLHLENVNVTRGDLSLVLSRFQKVWPRGLVENGDDPEGTPATSFQSFEFEADPQVPVRNLFVYRDETSCQKWNKDGWTEDADQDMIHIIATESSLTLVGGDTVSTDVSQWVRSLAVDLRAIFTSRASVTNQLKIKEEVARILTTLHQAQSELDKVRSSCTHPDVVKAHKANTGNYDPSADCYWTEFRCPDCGKFWRVDGSV